MGLLKDAAEYIETIFDEKKHCEYIGKHFEIYAMKMFNPDIFTIEYHNNDTYIKEDNKYPIANTYPDLVIIYKPTKEKFAVECKLREYKKNQTEITFGEKRKRDNYVKFQKTNNMPVFILFGLGDTATKPDEYNKIKRMFIIPLDDIKNFEKIFIDNPKIKKYERTNPNADFYYDNINKKLK